MPFRHLQPSSCFTAFNYFPVSTLFTPPNSTQPVFSNAYFFLLLVSTQEKDDTLGKYKDSQKGIMVYIKHSFCKSFCEGNMPVNFGGLHGKPGLLQSSSEGMEPYRAGLSHLKLKVLACLRIKK